MFRVTITEADHELTKRERVIYADTSDAKRLDELTQEGPYVVHVTGWAKLEVTNDEKTYNNFVLMDGETKIVTGSENFWRSFLAIAEQMEGEDYSIKCYRRPSKNYSGKSFLTCSLI